MFTGVSCDNFKLYWIYVIMIQRAVNIEDISKVYHSNLRTVPTWCNCRLCSPHYTSILFLTCIGGGNRVEI